MGSLQGEAVQAIETLCEAFHLIEAKCGKTGFESLVTEEI